MTTSTSRKDIDNELDATTVNNKLRDDSLIDFLIYTRKKMLSLMRTSSNQLEIHLNNARRMNALSSELRDSNCDVWHYYYNNKEEVPKKFKKRYNEWKKLRNNIKNDRLKAHAMIEKCIKTVRTIEDLVTGKQLTLVENILSGPLKEVIISVMWVSYPREYNGIEKYSFETNVSNMKWLGFEWIYGYTSKVGGTENNPNVEDTGWYLPYDNEGKYKHYPRGTIVTP